MIRKIVTTIILIPLGLMIVVLAVANREIVTISLDPFNAIDPAFSIKAPLFILALALVAFGVVIGGVAMWIKHWKMRASRRKLERELQDARLEIDRLRRSSANFASGQLVPPGFMRQPPAA